MRRKFNRKGCVKIEFIVFIIILTIMISLVFPAYYYVLNNKNKLLDEKITLFEGKAKEWAKDNNISEDITISLFKLVVTDYLGVDYDFINPLTNETMICNTVDITYEDNEIKTKFNKKSNDCEVMKKDNEEETLKINLYNFDSQTNKVYNQININNNVSDWANKDVLVVVSSYKEYNKISYSYNETKTIKLDNNILSLTKLNDSYNINPEEYINTFVISSIDEIANLNIELFTNNKSLSKDITIKFDLEAPQLDILYDGRRINYDDGINISCSDTKSGVKGFYVTNIRDGYIPNESDFVLCSDEVNIKLKNGIYYFYTLDNASNISSPYAKTLYLYNVYD